MGFHSLQPLRYAIHLFVRHKTILVNSLNQYSLSVSDQRSDYARFQLYFLVLKFRLFFFLCHCRRNTQIDNEINAEMLSKIMRLKMQYSLSYFATQPNWTPSFWYLLNKPRSVLSFNKTNGSIYKMMARFFCFGLSLASPNSHWLWFQIPIMPYAFVSRTKHR